MGNPNHDDRGRFASKGGASTFKTKGGTYRTEAQDRASLAKMRSGAKAIASLGVSTPRQMASIRRDVRNVARVVERRWGSSGTSDWTAQNARALKRNPGPSPRFKIYNPKTGRIRSI